MKKFSTCLLCLAFIASMTLPTYALDVKAGLKSAVSSVGDSATEDGLKAIKIK